MGPGLRPGLRNYTGTAALLKRLLALALALALDFLAADLLLALALALPEAVGPTAVAATQLRTEVKARLFEDVG